MENLINQDYRNWFNDQAVNAFYLLSINAPLEHRDTVDRLVREFKNPKTFLREFDFMAFELPLNVAKWSNGDWEAIRDFCSDCDSELCEAEVFSKNPQSVDPINY